MKRARSFTSEEPAAPLLLVDWRWRPGLFAAPDRWLGVFETAFPNRPLTLMIDRPLDPDQPEVLELLEAMSGRARITLLVPTFLDSPIPQFLKRLPLLGERLHVAVWLDPNAGREADVRERLFTLRDGGCEPALMWAPRVADIRLVPMRLGRLAQDGFAVCVLPPNQPHREPAPDPALQAILLRMAHPLVVRWMFAAPDVFGRVSTAGVDQITVQPDGTLYASPDDVTRNLGNLFTLNARLLSAPEPLRQTRIRSLAMLASLPELGLPPLTGNPVRTLMSAGGPVADARGVQYPLRFVDWEDDAIRAEFGLLPLHHFIDKRGLRGKLIDWIGGRQ